MYYKLFVRWQNLRSIFKLVAVLMLIAVTSCKQEVTYQKPNPAAVQLNGQAMDLIRFNENPDSAAKALALLDKATTIDSKYFLAYFNKLMFLSPFKKIDEEIRINNKLITLRPDLLDLYLYGGLWYE